MDLIIYKITCKEDNQIYINITKCDTIDKSITKFINNYKSWQKTNKYHKKIYDYINLKKIYEIELLEKCYDIDNVKKNIKKKYWINKFKNNCINHLIEKRNIKNHKKNTKHNKQNINYQNGKIYKLVCNITDNIYIGSTIRDLNIRLLDHIKNYDLLKINNKTVYCSMSWKILENNDYDIELIEEYPCNTKQDLESRERYWIEQYINDGYNCVNKLMPIKTEEEKKETSIIYRQENKEKISTKQKIHRLKDDVKEQRANYNKEYRETHHEQVLEKNRQYYQDNKEKILEQMKIHNETKEKQYCDICKTYVNQLNEHIKSKKHIDNINKKTTNDENKTEYIEKKITEKYCEVCKKSYDTTNFARHLKSKKHLNNL